MKRTMKRIGGMIVCILFLLSLLPANALAVTQDPAAIVQSAYALAEGETLPYEVTLTGRITSILTPYDDYWQTITVQMIVAGCETMPIVCYRLRGEGVDRLEEGDTITVTGMLSNYYGSIEFFPCTLDYASVGVDYYVAGSQGLCGVEWLTGYPENKMELGSDGYYFKQFVGIAAGYYELKVATETWAQSWGADGDINNYSVLVEQDNSSVTIYFDPETKMIYHEVSSYSVPDEQLTTPAEIVDAAYALDDGEMLEGTYSLTGQIISIDTPYSLLYNNITVSICVSGRENMPIQCYRMKGDGADQLTVGDIITVTGQLMNYSGMIEFTVGCYFTWEFTSEPPVIPTPEEIVDAAYELEPGAQLPYQAALTGTIVEIVSPYDENYHNITVTIVVEGKEDKPIVCYRMRGDGLETLQLNDVITVHGTIQNYAKYDYETDEILYTTVEFSPCQLLEKNPVESILLYCLAPTDWDSCYIYTWDIYGSATGQWPGTQMIHEGNGLWSFEVPATVEGIVFNDGWGGNDGQSDDLFLPTDDRNVYVVADKEWLDWWMIDTGYPNLGDLHSLALVGDGIPGVPVWYPEAPEGDMTQVSDYVYEKTVEAPAGTFMNFKIAGNDCWDDNWNFGSTETVVPGQKIQLNRGAGSTDMTLEVDHDCTLKFIVDLSPLLEGKCATLLVQSIDPPISTRCLTVITPDSWDELYIYSWNPELYGGFPGARMLKQNGVYRAVISNDALNLVFSDYFMDGFQISSDVFMEDNGRDVTVTIYEDGSCSIRYDSDIDDWDLHSLALVGDGIPGVPEWHPDAPEGDMTQVSTYVYEKIVKASAGTFMNFKIAGNDCWDDNWNFGGTETVVLGQKIQLNRGDGSSALVLEVDHDCTLKFTVDLSPLLEGKCATLLVEDLTPKPTRMLTVVAPDSWITVDAYTWEPYSLGDFPGTSMYRDGDVYKMQIPLDMVNLVISGQREDGTRMQTSDIRLENNNKNVIIIIKQDSSVYTYYGDQHFATYRVVGNAAWMGNWDAGANAGKMERIGPDKYQTVFQDVAPGNYEFKITRNGKWEDAIGDQNGYNICFSVGRTCDVTVRLTFQDGVPVVDMEYIPVCLGDVTGDDRVNLGDVARLYAHIRGHLLTDALRNGDFSCDGKVNIGDVAGLYAYIRCTDPTTIVDAAYRLGLNQELPLTSTLTGRVIEVVEPYNERMDCITVCILVTNRELCPVLCTRLTGKNAEKIGLDDRITVTGKLRNYYGAVEFKEGCRLINWEDVPGKLEQMQQRVDAAYELGVNEAMNEPTTLTGKVVSVDYPYTYGIPYISVTIAVEGREDKPIFCYRLMGAGIEFLSAGDVLTVSGTLRNYNGAVEFREGCQLEEYLVE